MWFTLSKLLGYLLSPLPFSMILVVGGAFFALLGARIFSRILMVSGVGLLLICSMPVVERSLKMSLQNQYPPRAIEDTENAGLIVVLGGAVAMPYPPRLEVELHESSDRVLHAFRLYQANKAPLIFLSAGNVYDDPEVLAEAEYIKRLLVEWGVPASAIVTGGESRTTRENATETMSYLRSKGEASSPVLLVTSASHMPRAMATFRGANIDAIAATTDVSAGPGPGPSIYSYLPSIDALRGVSRAWHEILGTWVYQIRGWI